MKHHRKKRTRLVIHPKRKVLQLNMKTNSLKNQLRIQISMQRVWSMTGTKLRTIMKMMKILVRKIVLRRNRYSLRKHHNQARTLKLREWKFNKRKLIKFNKPKLIMTNNQTINKIKNTKKINKTILTNISSKTMSLNIISSHRRHYWQTMSNKCKLPIKCNLHLTF